MYKWIFLLVLISLILWFVPVVEMAVSSHVLMGSVAPLKCSPLTGDIFFKTTSTPTGILGYCSSINTWTFGGATGNQNLRDLRFIFNGNGSALTGTATLCYISTSSGTITGAYISSDVSGNITFDVQTVLHSSYTGFSSASSIVGAGTKPNLSSSAVYTDETLTSWSTTLAAKTDVCAVMSSPSTVSTATLVIRISAN